MAFDVLHKVIYFIVVLGILIAFHEFGHFWVARRMGVTVLRFSIGFGKPLLKFRPKDSETEYVISAIPLGGYVKMLGQGESVEDHQKPTAFDYKSPYRRIAIVAAGPIFNLVLAVFLFIVVFMSGIPEIKPVVNEPPKESPAYIAGVQHKDVVMSVQGESVESWSDTRIKLIENALVTPEVTITVERSSGVKQTLLLKLNPQEVLDGNPNSFEKLGLKMWRAPLPSVVNQVSEGSAAEKIGLKENDQLLRIGDRDVSDWNQLIEVVAELPGATVPITFLRNQEEITKEATLGQTERDGKQVGLIGIGVKAPETNPYAPYQIVQQYGLVDSSMRAVEKTWDSSLLMLRMLSKIVVGEASVKNLSGPLTIAQYAGESAKIGLNNLLLFMAAISVSLGVLNLLPIPVLDGGHLVYYTIELIKGSPVSEQFMMVGQMIGLMVLMLLMIVAFYNDITRIFG